MTHDVSKVREVRRALAQGVGITDPCGQATGGVRGGVSQRAWSVHPKRGGRRRLCSAAPRCPEPSTPEQREAPGCAERPGRPRLRLRG